MKNDRRNPIAFHGGLALALSVLVAFGLWRLAGASSTVWAWLAAWLAAANLVALAYYGFDKHQAGRDGRRVPELVLHGLALAGGSVGAYLGMQLFRHKTLKGRFQLVFWVIVALQLAAAGWAAHALWSNG